MAGLFSRPTKEGASEALVSGDLEGAIKQYRRLIKDDAHDHELFNDLGMALLGSGEPAEAAEAFSTANDLLENALHTNNLGRAYLMLCDAGRYRDSLPHLEAVAEQGAEVVAAAEDGQTQITVNGRIFWQGPDAAG